MPEPGMGGSSDDRPGASGGSGGTPGLGGSQDVGSGFAGPSGPTSGGGGGGGKEGPSAAEVQAAIDKARKSGKSLGIFTADDYADDSGILGLIGYDTKKSFFDNVIDITVPGKNTPLGILSAAIPGLTKAQQLAVGLANTIAGKKINESKTATSTPTTDSIVEGIMSTLPGYTGRPDDAPAPSQFGVDFTPNSMNVGIASGKPTTSVGPSAFGVKARQVGTLEDMQRGLQQLADNIVSIPGGYMDTKTGMTYAGDYQKNPKAKTVTGKYIQGVQPFSLEAFKQNLFGS